MSRIPPPSSSRSRPTLVTPSSRGSTTSTTRAPSAPSTPTRVGTAPRSATTARGPAPSRLAPSTSTNGRRSGTVSPSKPGARSPLKSPSKPLPELEPEPPRSPAKLSVREQIALRRAEAKKAAGSGRVFDGEPGPDSVPGPAPVEEEEDALGRLPLREVIERAKGSGNLNMTSRDLVCLPPEVFELHLGITPEPLPDVPSPAPLPESTSLASRRRAQAEVSWYEQVDLSVLKVPDNALVAIQPELSMFGSLKVIDLHKNKLAELPPALADLMALTHLDVSHNLLTALPPNLYALPHLVHLNVSHNALSALPFSTPFTSADGTPQTLFMGAHDRRDPFAPVLSRASKPLPALVRLEASNNCLSAASIDAAALPRAVTYIDLSHNPLGANFEGLDLISAFAALPHLSEAHLAHTALTDDAFPPPSSLDPFFPTLTLLDVSSAPCTAAKLVAFLHPAKREIDAQPTATPPRPGTIRLLVGTSVVKESWEVEAERRTTARRAAQARAAEALVAARAEETETSGAFGEPPRSPQKAKSAAAKEAWELEAEAGLMTAAGRRRARAAAAAAANGDAAPPSAPPSPTKPSAEDVEPPTHLLSFSQYYDASSRSLSLPATRAAPGRPLQADTRLPRTALPLALITASPIGATLKVLALSGRRADPSVTLPDEPVPPEGLLPQLDTLLLDDCRLADTVPGSAEPLLELLVRLFPRLQTLDLAHNVLTSASLTASALSALILASPPDEDGIIARPGLRTLRLRGNAFDSLDGLAELAGDLFRGHRVEPGWHLEEIDVRDNALAKLPAELGMLPLDVFLVEGNTFRIPQRRVWEREGTKGLLAWLRGRME